MNARTRTLAAFPTVDGQTRAAFPPRPCHRTHRTPATGGASMSDQLIAEIKAARFTPVRLRPGYDMGEVDQLLDEVVAALAAGRPVAPLVDDASITTVSFREGYEMADVDALLARARASDAGAATPPPAATTPPTPTTVVEEQRGLLSKLFGRR